MAKKSRIVSNPAKTGRVEVQIWSDQHQTLQKLFSNPGVCNIFVSELYNQVQTSSWATRKI